MKTSFKEGKIIVEGKYFEQAKYEIQEEEDFASKKIASGLLSELKKKAG